VGIINQGKKKIKGQNIWHSNAKHKNGLKQIRVWQVDRPSACQGHKKPWERRFESKFQTKNKTRLHDSKQ
jgi:hypothetical protein